jgi:hypothetical protein
MKKLNVEISNTLHDKFYREVTEVGGIWRSKDQKETAGGAFQSAIEVAMQEFLDAREKKRSNR